MAWTPITGSFLQYGENDVDASGFYMKFYASGTTTPISMAIDSTGATTLAKCQLDTDGMPINGSGAAFIPHIDRAYKLVIYRNATDADNNTFGSAYKEIDSLSPFITTATPPVLYFDTVAAMKAATHSLGDLVETKGFTTAGDGGGGKYLVEALGAPDGYGDHATDDGLYQLTLQNHGNVSVKQFGATGDGVTDDTAAIQAALNTGKAVFISEGDFFIGSSIAYTSNSQTIYGVSDKSKIIATGSTYLNSNGYSYIKLRDCAVYGDGNNGFFRIVTASKQVSVQDVYFYKGGQRIWLYDCSEVSVSRCTFRECGYQVIQQLGYASSDCSVDNCNSYDCLNDFVELNCEVNNPSKNWAIRNNNVYNVGISFGVQQTESRFVGATMVDGIIISGNYVDGVAGDSAIHLERYTNAVIDGNIIKNVSGAGVIYLIPGQTGAPAGTEGRTDCIITNNQFITDEATFNTPPFIRSIDGNYYSKLTIVNNQFTYFGVDYPAKPTTKAQTGILIGFLLQSCTIQNNTFKYLATGVILDENSGGVPLVTYPRFILNNTFEECDLAIDIVDNTDYPLAIDNNVFDNCVSSVSLLNYGDSANFLSLSANVFMNSPLDLTDMPISPKWQPNKYQDGSVVVDPRASITVTESVQTKIIKIPFGFVGLLNVKAERTTSATNNIRKVYAVSNRAATTVTELATAGAGVQPSITITPTGANATYLEFTIGNLGGDTAEVEANLS